MGLVIVRGAFKEGAELARARRMPELAQCFRFDLADTFASDGERLPDFFEGVLAAVVETETHLDDFLFARRQSLQYRRSLLLQAEIDDRIGRRYDRFVFYEIAEMRILFLADGSFERNGFLRDF